CTVVASANARQQSDPTSESYEILPLRATFATRLSCCGQNCPTVCVNFSRMKQGTCHVRAGRPHDCRRYGGGTSGLPPGEQPMAQH
ncbi:MAG: hypothetical protein Q8Q12_06140, partial [bacterium]|nr:hypothetical protein [bacterium]